MTSPAPSPVPGRSSRTRLVGIVLAACAVVLVPWAVHLADTLPDRAVSRHYAAAWTGFDVMLFVALGTTAILVLRRSLLMGAAGTWSAALLVADAWFDVMTAPTRSELVEALLLAVLVELPLAALCLWVLRRAREIAQWRLRAAAPPDCPDAAGEADRGR
ncbi:MAG: hypothetical protein ACTHNS_07450 [Marmoricola sp.]